MTVGSLFSELRSKLTEKFSPSEAKEMSLLIFESLKDWTQTDLLIHNNDAVSDYIVNKATGIVNRTLKGEPLQYILGVAHFYGLKFKVTPATLIPRPETTELVDLIVDNNTDRKDLKVLDLGTGSGCIAISLARNLKFPLVSAIDISSQALAVARENAKALNVAVDFRQEDILNLPAPAEKYDIIVSNPPYILTKEAENMDLNVLDYEPHTALFVPDNDPLKFYIPIIEFAERYLDGDGQLYFEINPLCAISLSERVKNAGFRNVEIVKDISGKDRFIYAVR